MLLLKNNSAHVLASWQPGREATIYSLGVQIEIFRKYNYYLLGLKLEPERTQTR